MGFINFRSNWINNIGFILAYLVLSLTYLLSLQYVPATLFVEMKISVSGTGQLFYDTGSGYRETDSILFFVESTEEFESYQFNLPRGKINSIRIDPLMREGNFAIRSITVKTGGDQQILVEEELREALISLNQVELSYKNGEVHGISTGEDPYFGIVGSQIANRHPLYISIGILLLLLILIWGAKKFFSYNQYELCFALCLIIFALPIILPIYFSLLLTAIAVLLYLYIIVRSKRSQQASLLKNEAACVYWARLDKWKWFYAVGLTLALLLAFLLRFWNLIILDPYTDEYSHLLAAKDYLDTGILNYTRASLVTYLTALFFRIGSASTFYEYLFWGRIPGVIFSSLTVLPIYYLARKISRPVALLSAFLWATSPWAIGVSRTIREYAFYPLFILLGALILVKLLELLFDFKKEYLYKILLCVIPVIALIYHAFYDDIASTLRICAIVFVGFAAYYLVINYHKMFSLMKKNKPTLLVFILIASLIVISMLIYAQKSGHVSISELKMADYWFRVFFVPGSLSVPMHWWGDYSFVFIALFLATIGFFDAVIKKREKYFMHLAVFSFLLVFFMFFFDRYGRPRYIFYALPFFIPLVAVTITALVNYVKRIKPISFKIFCALAVIFFIFQAFNYRNILYPVISDEHGYVRTTNEHHDSLRSTVALLEKEISPNDVFITTIARSMLLLSFNIDEERIASYNYQEENRFEKVERVVAENPQGFIILDWRRNGQFAEGYPTEGQFMIGDTLVEVIQNKDGMQVYRWKR
ncbi:MAG: hypothetical protein AB1767_07700 [Bacillota bacterium]